MKKTPYFLALLMLMVSSEFMNLYSAAPTLLRPAIGSCYLPGDTLVWREESNVLSYVVNVSMSSDMSNPVLTKGGMITSFVPSDTTPELFPGTTYYWQVRAYYNTPGAQDASAIWTFKTPDIKPSLMEPSNAASCQPLKLTLKWMHQPGYIHHLQVSNSTSFESPFFDFTDLGIGEKAITLPDNGTTYYWRVQSVSAPCTTEWCDPRSFTTKMAPASLLSPSNNTKVNTSLVNFRWNTAVTTNSHRIQVASDSDFVNVIFDDFPTKNSYKGDIDTITRDIYWRVNYTSSNCETDWSGFYKFTTEFISPVLVSPKQDSNCIPLFIKFEWQAMTNVLSYHLQIASDSEFTNLVIDKTKINRIWDTLSVPQPFTYYYWRMKAEDDNTVGIWSPVNRFKTGSPVPVRVSPMNKDTVPIDVTFSWNKITTGAKYRIQISETNDFASPVLDKVLTDTSLTYKLPSFYKKYYWRVSADILSCTGAWSPNWEFKTRGLPPTLELPANDAKNQILRPRFTWTKPEGAEKYSIQICKDINFKTLVMSKSGILGNSYIYDKDLEPFTSYFWRVLASSTQGSSLWSQPFSFTTGEKGPDNPQLISPPNNTTGMLALVKFLWKTSPGAKSYQLLLDTNENFSNPVKTINDLTDTSYSIGNLGYSTIYYWLVNAVNDVGVSSSDVWNFKTAAMAPVDTAKQIAPPNNSIDVKIPLTFIWQSVNRADYYELELNTDSQFDKKSTIYHDSIITSTSKYLSELPQDTEIFWRVRGRNEGGKGPWTEPWKFKSIASSVENNVLAERYKISINPNPNNGDFVLRFEMKESKLVSVTLCDILGTTIKELRSDNYPAGSNSIAVSYNNLSSGIYFLKIKIDYDEILREIVIEK